MEITMKAARINAGYTQKEAARLLKVSRDTVSNWERGKSYPDVANLRDIERVYNVRYDDLVFLPFDTLKAQYTAFHKREVKT